MIAEMKNSLETMKLMSQKVEQNDKDWKHEKIRGFIL